jgi:Ca2+-binding RTX toxin-like protein
VSTALQGLIFNTQYSYGEDLVAYNVAIRDFMEVLAGHVASFEASDAILNLAWNNNLEGLDAVIDNLTEAHLLPHYQGGLDEMYVSAALQGLVINAQYSYGEDLAAYNVAIRDFMEVLSGHVTIQVLDDSLQTLSMTSNFEGIDAIASNITSVQIDALSSVTEDTLADAGVYLATGGNDYVYNAGASVSIHGLGGNDIIHGGSGDNHIFGGDGNDTLYAFRGGNNTLHGGNGNDLLYAGNGNDVLYGGDGQDTLIGSGGADTYVFRQDDTGVDTIYGFSAAQGDRLDISDFLDQYDPLQDAIDDFVQLRGNGYSTIISVDADGLGSGEAVDIAVLYGTRGVTIEDVLGSENIV